MFLQNYEISTSSKHYITNSKIEPWLNESNPGSSMKKFGIELSKHFGLFGMNSANEV